MAISIKLEAFEGPLDLLLHLIEKNKVDIYDIPIAMITDQYMEYIHEAEKNDLSIMSEFLVMAATLLELKCRMLLPREVNEEGEEIDPRDEMVRQLLEYKMYKYMSLQLRDLREGAGLSISRKPSIPKEVERYKPPLDYDILVGDCTLKKLNDIFKELMRRASDRIDPVRSKFGNIEKEEINLSDQLVHIRDFAREHGSFTFKSLLRKKDSKAELVVTFMVVLEFVKNGIFILSQEELFADINIEYSEEADLAFNQIGEEGILNEISG